ncbi:MAG: lysophospholipid acyltransferase family protein [Spirulina sp.]
MPNSANLQPGWSLDKRNPDRIRSLMPLWGWLYRYYFRVQTEGWENIPEGQVLLVGSHNGGLAAPDMVMMMYDWFRRFGTDRQVYGLMHRNIWQVCPPLANLAAEMGAILAHPKMAIAAIHRGASLLVYPGGAKDVFRPHRDRDKIQFADRVGFIKLALREKLPIVPAISHGAHDTLIVLGDFYEQAKQLHQLGLPWLFGPDPEVFPIYLGLPWGLAIGPLPNIPFPVPMKTRVCPPIYFARYGREAASDRDYVRACAEKVQTQMQQQLNELSREG